MAKMFYTTAETTDALGCNEEDLKQLAREGRLREFRDGSRLMFKADQVEALAAENGAPLRAKVELPLVPPGNLEPESEEIKKFKPLAEMMAKKDYLAIQAAISTGLVNIALKLDKSDEMRGVLLEFSDYLNRTIRGIEENRREVQEKLNALVDVFGKATNAVRAIKLSSKTEGGI